MVLSEQQTKVIHHTIQPALVLAGPGSGKTLVVTKRLCNLLERYPTSKIICLTFSKAAALEMETRFKNTEYGKVSSVHFSTIHSLAYSILKRGWNSNDAPLLLESKECPFNKQVILRKIYEEVNDIPLSSPDIDKLTSWISRVRNYTHEKQNVKSDIQIKNFKRIYSLYIEYKKENNLIDYDDMIIYALDILRKNSEQKEYWQKQYDFIQVDEAQDLTVSQFDIIKIIMPRNNIFIVADDDQSIYGFRGADPKNIMKFEKDMADCKKYILSDNYRCAPEIIRVSSNVIKNNTIRFTKKFISKSNNAGKVYLLHSKNTFCQAKFISSDILKRNQNSFGILYRNNSSSLVMASILIYHDISFKISGGNMDLYIDYINLFLIECIKNGNSYSTMPDLFKYILKKNFIELCYKKKKLHEQDYETIRIAIDFLYTVFNVCKNLNDVRNLLIKLNKLYESSIYQGNILPKKEIFLSTIHSAKGLEYDAVYLIDINKNEFPGKSAVSGSLLEEERRLFYVGITRTKRVLHLMFVENHGLQPAAESVFYKEAIKAKKEGGYHGKKTQNLQ